MKIETIEVRKDDLSASRAAHKVASPLAEGEILVKVERFALTANNITYAVIGDQFGYWKFFPTEAGWGVVPVWGTGVVAESRASDVKTGERIYGYFPMGSHLVMRPGKIRPERFVDAAAHRDGLPAVYNAYARLGAEPGHDAALDELRMLLFPLYATSFCLYDYFLDNKWFGAERVIVLSASSKTAIGVGYALGGDKKAPKTLGLTSSGNAARLRDLKVYDSVETYDRIDLIDAAAPTAIIDMSGNGSTLAALHRRLGDKMLFTSNVGITHADARRPGEGYIRERSALFFAPSHIEKRARDWGPGEFERRAFAFWKEAALKSRDWVKIERYSGAEAAQAAFHKMRKGDFAPEAGVIVAL
jgi:hypothetical protein